MINGEEMRTLSAELARKDEWSLDEVVALPPWVCIDRHAEGHRKASQEAVHALREMGFQRAERRWREGRYETFFTRDGRLGQLALLVKQMPEHRRELAIRLLDILCRPDSARNLALVERLEKATRGRSPVERVLDDVDAKWTG